MRRDFNRTLSGCIHIYQFIIRSSIAGLFNITCRCFTWHARFKVFPIYRCLVWKIYFPWSIMTNVFIYFYVDFQWVYFFILLVSPAINQQELLPRSITFEYLNTFLRILHHSLNTFSFYLGAVITLTLAWKSFLRTWSRKTLQVTTYLMDFLLSYY